MSSKNILLIIIFITGFLIAQDRQGGRDEEPVLGKTLAIEDRAGGTHNASNIGLFFENRGKLYPRRITQGPSGEFPINSGKHYIYRVNPMVGIPGNVVQARYTNNEEWEAVGGYHNKSLAKIAMSDNPATWHPELGWPVKDAEGNLIIKSDQDSYCVYSDSNNSRKILNIQVVQSGFAYGVKAAQNILFYKYDIINYSSEDYDKLYFGLYSDIDVGNISGGVPEYGDDKLDIDKERNFVLFFDDGISTEWPENKTGFFGIAFLSTPNTDNGRKGITDLHYNLYFDDEDQDTIQYGIMSSSESLFNSPIGHRYFHPGSTGDLHFDDPSTIPESGLDLVANLSSGPYTLRSGDTLSFVTAFIAGETLDETYSYLDVAERIVEFDFDFSRPPDNSNLSSVARDGKVYLYWDDKAERSFDKFTNEYDFEGYRVYRSIDNGVKWTLLADYDIKNFIGNDVGLRYHYVDSTVTNGFEYWYSVTAYDRGSTVIESLESPKGNTVDAVNLVSVLPFSAAAGYNPASGGNISYTGNGIANYVLNISPVDREELSGNNYKINFDYSAKRIVGTLQTESEIIIRDSSKTTDENYKFEFLGPGRLQVINMNTGDFLEPTPKSYVSGARYNLNSGLAVRLTEPNPDDIDLLPKEGDAIMISFVSNVVKSNSDTVINKRPFDFLQPQTTSDGVTIKFDKPAIIQDVSKIGGTDLLEIEFHVDDENLIKDEDYIITIKAAFDSSGTKLIPVIVVTSAQDTILKRNISELESFYFDGIRGNLKFNSTQVPAGNNLFSLRTVIPQKPNLRDSYEFDIKGSFVNKQRAESLLSNIKVVPNPYIVSSLYEPEFGELRREPLRQIQFINLPNECTIYIFTVDADLVKTIIHESVTGTAIWDLRAEGGREVAAGIYIYVVKSGSTEYKNRFAIIK